MSPIRKLLQGCALGLATLAPLAGTSHATPSMHMNHTAADSLTAGEVRKLDPASGKITIKHGPIQHLDMPSMTMVFIASDKALLDKVKVGDQIRFMVRHEGGKMLVTDIQPAK
ncbi:copper-binding protein [Craterilacuibacter sp.]|uniref:copper-binding protein n=1 Tax=Craterilacuibacter sp. TaxID=2870909 RepID=UPI003F352019